MSKVELSKPQVIHQLADRLVDLYPAVPPDQVVRVVQIKRARFEGRPVRDFIPLFVERYAKADLAKLSAEISLLRKLGTRNE
jgi:hypothetical protein